MHMHVSSFSLRGVSPGDGLGDSVEIQRDVALGPGILKPLSSPLFTPLRILNHLGPYMGSIVPML